MSYTQLLAQRYRVAITDDPDLDEFIGIRSRARSGCTGSSTTCSPCRA